MKKISLVAMCLLLSFMLAGCGSNKAYQIVYDYTGRGNGGDRPYNAELEKKIMQELSEEDGKIFMQALWDSFHLSNGFQVKGRKVGDIISDQKKYMEKIEQERKAAEEKKKRLRSNLATMVTAEVKRKYNKYQKFDQIIVFEVEFTNNTEKGIRAFEGIFHIDNLYGDRIMNLEYSSPTNAVLESEQRGGTTVMCDCNPFIKKEKQLYNGALSDFKITWETKKILFEDGSVKKK